MTSFTDNKGHEWQLVLSNPLARQLKISLGHDLSTMPGFLSASGSQMERLAFVYLMCESQSNKLGLDVDEFGSRLVGKSRDSVPIAHHASIAFVKACEIWYQQYGLDSLADLAKKQAETLDKTLRSVTKQRKSGAWEKSLTAAQNYALGK